jgi:hypothetical protein
MLEQVPKAQSVGNFLLRESSPIIKVVLRPNKSPMNTSCQRLLRIGPNGELPKRDNATGGACCQKQNKAECIVRHVSRLLLLFG